MIIDNPIVSGSLRVQNNVTASNGLFTGNLTVEGTINANVEGTTATASYVALDNVDGFSNVSSSLASRLSSQESFSSSLNSTFATDAELSAVSGALALSISSISTDFADITNKPTLVSSSAQIASDISGSFTNISSSLEQRVSTNETNISTLTSATSSYLLNTTDTLTGDLTVTGKITAQEFHTEFVSASIIYQSGSTKFGDTLDDNHQITGSVNITGSLFLNGTVVGTGKLDETVFNSYTSSTDIRLDNAEISITSLNGATGSYALQANISGAFVSTSSSLAQRITAQESFSSSLNSTFATDAELSAVSGALAATISGISTDFADITNKPTLLSGSAQIANDISGAFSSTSSSLSQRIAAQESFSSSLNSTFATDAELSAVSGALAATISGISTDFADITNKPTLISSSLQFNTLTTPFTGSFTGSFFGDGSNLSGVTSYTDSDTLDYINSIGVLSGSAQIASDISGSSNALSASITQRVSSLEQFSSSLDATFATDAQVSAAVSSLNTFTGSYNSGSFSGSFQGDGSSLTGITVSSVSTVQATFSSTGSVTINHNFNSKNVSVNVYNSSDVLILPDQITLVDNNNVKIDFAGLTSGFAVVARGGHLVSGSVLVPQVSTVSDTFTSTTSHTITHNFNTKEVMVSVYENDILIFPDTISTPTLDTVQITFPEPVTGRVVVVKAGHIVSGSIPFDNIISNPFEQSTLAVTASKHIVPSLDQTYDLGSPSLRFRDLYLSSASIFLGNTVLSEDSVVTTASLAAVLPANVVSSSAQIASDISGSFTELSSSLEQRVSTNESNISTLTSVTSSYALKTDISGSFTSVSASIASDLVTNYLRNTTDTLDGNLTVTGTITAQEFHTEFVSASIIYQSGSTKFGNSSDDVHQFTGSASITGSLSINGTSAVIGSGTTNYIPKFTAGSTIGDSIIEETASGINVAFSNSGASNIFEFQNTSNTSSSNSRIKIATGGTSGGNAILQFTDNTSNWYINPDSASSYSLKIGTSISDNKLVLTTSGNLGLGVTPSAWGGEFLGFDIGGSSASVISSSSRNIIASNLFYNGASYIYKNSDFALMHWLDRPTGQYRWYIAPSGTAGNAISFTQAMTLNASGNLSIGNTNDTYKLDVSGEISLDSYLRHNGDTDTFFGFSANDEIKFRTAGSDRLTILSTGASVFTSHVSIVNGAIEFGGAGSAPSTDPAIYRISGLNDLAFSINSTPHMTIKSGGNVGIGNTNPLAKIQTEVGNKTSVGLYSESGLAITSTGGSTGNIYQISFGYGGSDATYGSSALYGLTESSTGYNTGALVFATRSETTNTAPTERMRITSGGKVQIGTGTPDGTLTINSTTTSLSVITNADYSVKAGYFWHQATSGDNQLIQFFTEAGASQRGAIDYNRGAGLLRFVTTSDKNLKNIIGDSDKQKSVNLLNSTRIREYSWKDDESNKPQIGVIAQELYETYKGAVSIGSDEELLGTEDYKPWAVDKTAFTFHLIAGFQEHERIIQEQQSQIEILKAEIQLLKN